MELREKPHLTSRCVPGAVHVWRNPGFSFLHMAILEETCYELWFSRMSLSVASSSFVRSPPQSEGERERESLVGPNSSLVVAAPARGISEVCVRSATVSCAFWSARVGCTVSNNSSYGRFVVGGFVGRTRQSDLPDGFDRCPLKPLRVVITFSCFSKPITL